MSIELVTESNGLVNIAVDNGFARHKVAYWTKDKETGKRKLSCFSYASRAQMGAVNISSADEAQGVYDVDGEVYTVSDNLHDPVSMRGKSYAWSKINTALVYNSMLRAGANGLPVRVCTGLPLKHYFKDGDNGSAAPDTDLIERVKSALKLDVTSPITDALPEIAIHDVKPESISAHLSYAYNYETDDLRKFRFGVVYVDVGGNTTDITYMNANHTVNIAKSDTDNIGVLNIRDELKSLVRTEFKVDQIMDAQLDEAIETGKFFLYGQDKDVSTLLKKAKRQTVVKLNNFIQSTVGDAASADAVVFVGGGAEALRDEIKEEMPHATIPDDASYANAIGMLIYMTFIDPQSDFRPVE